METSMYWKTVFGLKLGLDSYLNWDELENCENRNSVKFSKTFLAHNHIYSSHIGTWACHVSRHLSGGGCLAELPTIYWKCPRNGGKFGYFCCYFMFSFRKYHYSVKLISMNNISTLNICLNDSCSDLPENKHHWAVTMVKYFPYIVPILYHNKLWEEVS